MQTASATKEYERIDMFILCDEIESLILEYEVRDKSVGFRETLYRLLLQKVRKYREGWIEIERGRLSPLDFDGRVREG